MMHALKIHELIKNNKMRCVVAFVVLLLIAGVWMSGACKKITLHSMQCNVSFIQEFIKNNYLKAVLIFIALYVIEVVLLLPLSALLTLASGYFFGSILGTWYSVIASTIGAIISFLLVRYLIGDFLHARYAKILKRFNESFDQYGWWYLLAVHFIFIIPFFIINIGAGLTRVPLWTFIWTTFLGIIPALFIYAFAGQQLTTITSLHDIFCPRVLLAFTLLSLFAFLPYGLKKIGLLKT
jgi:uncharacterized membrane protein YdjX (TVP38/TMEM64 family)